jgi:hypothetical protein
MIEYRVDESVFRCIGYATENATNNLPITVSSVKETRVAVSKVEMTITGNTLKNTVASTIGTYLHLSDKPASSGDDHTRSLSQEGDPRKNHTDMRCSSTSHSASLPSTKYRCLPKK